MHVHYTYRSAICLMPFCSTPALEKHPCSLHVPTSGGGHGSSVLLPLATMLPARPQYKYRPRLLANTVQLQTDTNILALHPSIFIPKIRRSTTLLVLLTSEEKLATAQSLCRSPMKAVCCSAAVSAVILLHLLLLGSATAEAASPTTTTQPPDSQGWAAARRLLLLQPTAIMATATNTFHVKGAVHQPATTTTTAAARGTKPTVEFNASTKSAPGSGFNPRQN